MSLRKVDANQLPMTRGIEAIGGAMVDLHTLGHGVPDALFMVDGKMLLAEIKMPGGRFTEEEHRWWRGWEACGGDMRGKGITTMTEVLDGLEVYDHHIREIALVYYGKAMRERGLKIPDEDRLTK